MAVPTDSIATSSTGVNKGVILVNSVTTIPAFVLASSVGGNSGTITVTVSYSSGQPANAGDLMVAMCFDPANQNVTYSLLGYTLYKSILGGGCSMSILYRVLDAGEASRVAGNGLVDGMSNNWTINPAVFETIRSFLDGFWCAGASAIGGEADVQDTETGAGTVVIQGVALAGSGTPIYWFENSVILGSTVNGAKGVLHNIQGMAICYGNGQASLHLGKLHLGN